MVQSLILEKSETKLVTGSCCLDLIKENSVHPSTVKSSEKSYLFLSMKTNLPIIELGERRRFSTSASKAHSFALEFGNVVP